MFAWRGVVGPVEVAFTDRDLDLRLPDHRERLRRELDAEGLDDLNQVHGDSIVVAGESGSRDADALVTDVVGRAVLVRVADCVPVAIVAPKEAQVAVVHAGRAGVMADIAGQAALFLRERGATDLQAWIGPHICGHCYELPEELADEVERRVPGTRATTSWGTPSADLGVGVRRQLERHGVVVHDLSVCTLEDDRFHSHRGGDEERFGVVAVIRP